MSDRFYVLAIFSEVHNCWFELVGTDKPDKIEVVQALARQLVELCPVQCRIVTTASDEPGLIRAALGKLALPALPFIAKDFAMYCETMRRFEAELHAGIEAAGEVSAEAA